MTEHFSSPQWVDLVRGLLSEDRKTEMDQHLRAGCEECREAFAAWSGFATFAEAEPGFEPPREAAWLSAVMTEDGIKPATRTADRHSRPSSEPQG